MSDTKNWFEEEIKSATDEMDKLPAWVQIAAEFHETLFESDTRDVFVPERKSRNK